MVLDVEKVENFDTEPRTRGLSAEEYTRNVLAFADEMKKEGYDTIIYGNGKTFMLMLDMSMLEDIDKWFADYVAEDDYVPYFPYDFSIWQFSSQGHVAGISGDVDLNIRFEKD
jgi:GH25 family lysozyme M1 (1,4-beta-N-acetylmuramidase)